VATAATGTVATAKTPNPRAAPRRTPRSPRRSATPARAGAAGDGVLRFSFPDTDRFAEVEWREFFEEFEREGLALVYQPAAEDVEDPNRFYKLVDRATV